MVCSVPSFISAFALISRHACFYVRFCLRWSCGYSRMSDTFCIQNWMILWSSYRKLSCVGVEPTTTEFHSEVLNNWAIMPWVQLSLRTKFVQPLQFHRLFSVKFHFGYCLHQSQGLFLFGGCLRKLQGYVGMNDRYGIDHWRILWSSYRKLAWVGFEPTTTEFH